MAHKRGKRFTNNFTRGFSLIELMVVISIIAILSTVTLALLSGARGKGADAGIKADLKTIQTQSAIVFSNNGCYTDTVTETPNICDSVIFPAGNCSAGVNHTLFQEQKIEEALEHAGDASVNNGGIAQASCIQAVSSGAWAISVPLKTDPLKSWCVDSNGTKREVTPVGADRGFNSTNCK